MLRSRRALALALLLGVLGSTAATAAPTPAERKRVVVGTDGYLFSAQDWTVPCQDADVTGNAVQHAVDLARALEASGRRAVVTIGPDKSTVLTGNLPRTVPVGACHAAQHDRLWRGVTASPSFLDLRAPLQQASRARQVYYRKDTHWSHDGDTVFARSLLRRFDPLLALGQTVRATSGTVRGDLASVLGLPAHELVRGQSNVNPGVVVRELPQRQTGIRVPLRSFVATATTPGARLLPGRTVFVGDSFTAVALSQLVQLSEETVFVWTDNTAPLGPMLDEIAQGDRVVVEVVERFATRYRMFRPDVVEGVRGLPRRTPLPVPAVG